MLVLGAIFTGVTFVVFAAYGLCAAAVRHRVIDRRGVVTRLRATFAACFVALGARPAWM
ncbi:hypothetical protein ACN20G_36690 (plasmid) [Streptomyces sp. BI20]|uniref:hypothetical protein n=1 Tax=Streptomyces sp. BI20 TaxID=3403460 RepID=UPI003C731F62